MTHIMTGASRLSWATLQSADFESNSKQGKSWRGKAFLISSTGQNLLIITRFQIKLLKATFHNLPKQQHVFVHLCYLINLSTMSILHWGMLQKQSIARENDKIKLLPRNTSKEVPLLLVKQTNNPTSTPTKPVQKHGQRVSLCVLNETSGLACSRVGGLLA